MFNIVDWWTLIKWILLGFFATFLFLLVFSQLIVRILRKYYHFPIPAFLTQIIDNPIRRKFIQKPPRIVERMHLAPNMIVVEIGPGKGNYTKAVARKILPGGKLFAVDIQERVVEKLRKKVLKERISNIIPKIDDAYNFSFEDESIDRVLAIACIPEIPDPIKVLKECKRILKPDGIISLCELAMDPDYPWRKTEKKWAREAGLELFEEFGNWFVYQLNFCKDISKY